MPNLFLELQDQNASRQFSPAPVSNFDALQVLETAEITASSLIPWGSNYSFAVALEHETGTHLGIYKPRAGEAPLHDFLHGTLYLREIAAYRLSRMLEWNIVPPTVERDGPHGVGSLQLYVQPGSDLEDPESFWGDTSLENERFVLFDHVANNADRKLSHCLVDVIGRRWGIDHGLTFNEAPKLRTVMWQFSGERVSPELQEQLAALLKARPESEFAQLLTSSEREAFWRRVERMVEFECYPQLNPYRNIPYGW
ncbi:SCO1664 family protein [soil metagenome]